jgi:hypothetical protein
MKKRMSRREDVWARIGALLALLQHVEREIDMALTGLFPDQVITFEQIASSNKSQKKKTLGQLFRRLRELNPNMDRYKTSQSTFVENRNRFVHRLFTEKGYDINNPKDVTRIRKFVDSLTHHSIALDIAFQAINKVLVGEDVSVPLTGSFQWPPALKHRKGEFKRHFLEALRVG